jgi:WD40 repeat protein
VTLLSNGDIVSAGKDKVIKVWDSTSGIVRLNLTGHSFEIRALTTLPNDDIVSGSQDTSIRV